MSENSKWNWTQNWILSAQPRNNIFYLLKLERSYKKRRFEMAEQKNKSLEEFIRRNSSLVKGKFNNSFKRTQIIHLTTMERISRKSKRITSKIFCCFTWFFNKRSWKNYKKWEI